MDGLWTPAERAQVERMTRVSIVGSPDSIRRGLEAVVEATGADELMLTGQIFEHAARLRSFEIISRVHAEMGEGRVRPDQDAVQVGR